MTIHHELQQRIHAAVERLTEARQCAQAARQRDDAAQIAYWRDEHDRRYETCRNLMRQQGGIRA